MGGHVAQDDLFSFRKASERMGEKATQSSPSPFFYLDHVERENLQTRWVLMASRVSKFDSKEAVPGAQDTTRLRKFFRTDSRGELQFGLVRTVPPYSRGSLNFSRFISLRLMLLLRKGKTYSLELLAYRFTFRSSIKSFFCLTQT